MQSTQLQLWRCSKQLWFDSLCPLYRFWHLRRPLCDGLPDALSVGKSETSSNGTRHTRHTRTRLGDKIVTRNRFWGLTRTYNKEIRFHEPHSRSRMYGIEDHQARIYFKWILLTQKGNLSFDGGCFSCSGFNFCPNELLVFIKQRDNLY